MGKSKHEAAIEKTLASIRKQFGPDSVMRLDGKDELPAVEVSPTGSLGLDLALGVGGIPKGRVTEVYGPESSGKTTLCLHMVAAAQQRGAIAGYIDAEHALDLAYAKALGVKVEDVLLSQPDCGEQALEICEQLVSSERMGIIIVDSVAALTPKAELEGEMGDSHMALQARLMSQAMRKLCAVVARTGTILVFINQIRSKVGVIFGSPEVTPGGNALKFYASVRLDIRRIGGLKEGGDGPFYGNRTRVKVVKNKVARPFREAEFDIIWGSGIAQGAEVLDLMERNGFIEKSGAWYSYLGERVGQGRVKAVEWLAAHPDLMASAAEEIRKLGPAALAGNAARQAADAELESWANVAEKPKA